MHIPKLEGESGSPPGPGAGWHDHGIDPSPVHRGFFHGFVHNCCSTLSSCLYLVCCCWLLQDCFRAASDRLGPPAPPPPPRPHGPPGGPGPIGPSTAPFDFPGPPGQPAPLGPPSSRLERPLL